ncbi:MAG TPA: ABC transporter ATP-binding protein [Candidatus Kapabacteria bacterium]|nr:ABC transporter ATP-binding protein [Candidatus Kapabacteria bacterium]
MENEKIIKLKDIVFCYGNFKAIDNVTLDIGKGIYGLLGPNGAGKTTLMKLILGFLTPASGSGTVLGYDIADSPLEVRKRIGYMPESDCLIPGMDAVNLTSYLGELSGMPRQEAIKRAHEVLYYVGLEESRYRKVETYSTGMKQRMKLAAALVHDPELLFLDEPTSGMDPQGRKEMLELINDIAAKGTMNIILSSHILADVEAACKYVLIMNKGKIISEQEISSVLNLAALNIIELKLNGNIKDFQAKLPSYKMEMDDKNVFRIHLPADFPIQSLFKIAYDSKVQIRHFRKSKVTLEDAFVTAIGEGENHAD